MPETILFRAIFSQSEVWSRFYKTIEEDDLIYFYWGDKSILILPYLKKQICNKTYVRFHRTDLYEYANNEYIPFRKIVFPHIDWFLPISQDGKNYLLKNYSELTMPQRIKVCRLGVFDHGLNIDHDLNNDKRFFHLLSCSSVLPVKRIGLIIDTLKHSCINIRWTHIGSGYEFDTLKEKASSLNSNIEVDLLGEMTNLQVIDYYKNNYVDLFVNVSISEGIPVSIMEALSFGIPVFATNVGGTAEIINNDVGELLAPDIEPKKLAAKIEKFADAINFFA